MECKVTTHITLQSIKVSRSSPINYDEHCHFICPPFLAPNTGSILIFKPYIITYTEEKAFSKE